MTAFAILPVPVPIGPGACGSTEPTPEMTARGACIRHMPPVSYANGGLSRRQTRATKVKTRRVRDQWRRLVVVGAVMGVLGYPGLEKEI
jgi:hypothetical protein